MCVRRKSASRVLQVVLPSWKPWHGSSVFLLQYNIRSTSLLLLPLLQVAYGALDAFVSYACGVEVLRRAAAGTWPYGAVPPAIDLHRPREWELRAAAQAVCVSQFVEARTEDFLAVDCDAAEFKDGKVRSLL